jgi:hypothetical protein
VKRIGQEAPTPIHRLLEDVPSAKLSREAHGLLQWQRPSDAVLRDGVKHEERAANRTPKNHVTSRWRKHAQSFGFERLQCCTRTHTSDTKAAWQTMARSHHFSTLLGEVQNGAADPLIAFHTNGSCTVDSRDARPRIGGAYGLKIALLSSRIFSSRARRAATSAARRATSRAGASLASIRKPSAMATCASRSAPIDAIVRPTRVG